MVCSIKWKYVFLICPSSELRDLFHHIQEKVLKRFPEDDSVRYTCVSAFLFLRFFVPAILGPKLFGLIESRDQCTCNSVFLNKSKSLQYYRNAIIHFHQIHFEINCLISFLVLFLSFFKKNGLNSALMDSQVSRTLTLLAKTLQNLANLIEFGQKEPYMIPLNGFISKHRRNMEEFLDFAAVRLFFKFGGANMLSRAQSNNFSLSFFFLMLFLETYVSTSSEFLGPYFNLSKEK